VSQIPKYLIVTSVLLGMADEPIWRLKSMGQYCCPAPHWKLELEIKSFNILWLLPCLRLSPGS